MSRVAVVECCVFVLASAACHERYRSNAMSAGAAAVFVDAMGVHTSSLSVIDDVCRCVGAMAAVPAQLDVLVRKGVTDVLLTAVTTHRNVSSVLERVCFALKCVVSGRGIHSKSCPLSTVLDCMKSISIDLSLSEAARGNAARVLQAVLSFEEDPERITTLPDVVIGLKQAVSLPMYAEIAVAALAAVPRAVRGDKSLHREMGLTDGLAAAVVQILREHLDSEPVCRAGLAAIRVLCRYGTSMTTSSEETVLLLADAGACEIVVSAIKTHIDSAEIASLGCQAVRNLAAYPASKTRLGEAGCCETIVDSLIAHTSSAEVAEVGLAALGNLAFSDAVNRVRLGSTDACAALLSVLRFHIAEVAVVEMACLAIKNVAANNVDNKLRLGELGGCAAVVRVLTVHTQHASVVEQALWAVRNLAAVDVNRQRLGDVGACEVTVQALRTHNNVPEVIEQGCAALVNLAMNERNRTLLGAADACAAVMFVLRSHSTQSGVVEQGCHAINNLVAGSVDNKKKTLEVGAEHFMKALSSNTSLSEGARGQAAKALQSIYCFYYAS